MKFFAGILVVGGSLFLLFQSKIVSVGPSDISFRKVAIHKEEKPINIIFVGDVMLGRAVEEQYQKEDIFEYVRPAFNEADAVVANLEGPVLNNHIKTPYNSYKFSFATTTLGILKYAGFTDLTLANNHTDNYGRDGYAETVLNLKSFGLYTFGDPNLIAESSVSEREIGDKKFIFIGINDTYGNLTIGKILEFVSGLKAKFNDEILVVCMHWGEEYKVVANERQTKIGRGLIDAGVDLVIGSHPHVVQNLEKYNGKYIFYSLGNFVFDQYFSTSTQQGLAVRMKIGETGSEFELMPIVSNRSIPAFLVGEEKTLWLREYLNVNKISQFEIDGNNLK